MLYLLNYRTKIKKKSLYELIFTIKKTKNHHFSQKKRIFFANYFGETIVILIFATINNISFYSHI